MAIGPFRKKKAAPEQPEVEEPVPPVPNTTATASSNAMAALQESIKRRRRAAAGTAFGMSPGLLGSAIQRGIGAVKGTTTLIGK